MEPSEAANPTPAPAPAPPGLAVRLREKWPELLIEAFSVMLAVLAALAVDAWREKREQRQLADTVLAALVREACDNRAELADTRAAAVTSQRQIEELLQALEGGSVEGDRRLDLTVALALLSDSAWTMAQANGALRLVEPELALELAKLYEMQGWFDDRQRRTFERIGETSDVANDPAPLRRLARDFALQSQFSAALEAGYAGFLDAGRGRSCPAVAPSSDSRRQP